MAERHETQHAVVRGRGTLWLVWLIPLVALLMAGWLVYKHYAQKGVDIVVVFESGKGFEPGKTPLLYQGIRIGTVTDVAVEPEDIHKIRATITLDQRTATYITRKGTKFIKVEPKVSITEVTGLDTILSGVYIDLYPAGNSQKEILSKPIAYEFVGMDHYPPQRYERGLYLTLEAPEASVSLNAPVLYKSFIVGKVIDKRLEGEKVLYTAFVKQEYAHLVNAGSKFWKISGLEMKANLGGVKLKMDSLATLLAGGVAFESPEGNVTKKPRERYTLYPSELDTDLDASVVTVVADKAYNIDPSFSSVMYKGFEVGRIVRLHYDTRKAQTIFKIRLRRQFAHLANEKAWFWIVRPVLSIREVKGLDAILKGPYIALDTLDVNAPKKRSFVLHDEPIPLKGVTIHLAAIHAESLRSGTAIFYKDIPIGQIRKIRLVPNKKKLDVEAVIFEQYKEFLNDSSMFYVKSGFEMQMSLQGIHVDSASLETMVVGGVSMVTLDREAPRTKRNFFLYKDHKTFEKARYLKSGGARYHVVMKELGSLSTGSPLLYRKMKAGEIIGYRYLPKEDLIDVVVFVKKEFKGRINRSTRFKDVSGVELKMNFPELRVKMGSLETILTGGLLFETPDPRAPRVSDGHRFRLFDEAALERKRYTSFELWMDDTHDLKAGARLLYKNFPIGKVEKLELLEDKVKATVLIDKSRQELLRSDTVFWLKRFQMSMDGMKNVGNALTGPSLVLTPGRSEVRTATFALSDTPPPPTYGKSGLRVTLLADRRSSLDVGSPVYYRQVPVGQVEKWVLSDDAAHVVITAFIEPRYAHLVRENAKFYMAGAIGIEANLLGVKIKTETLKTIVSGGVSFVVPENPGPVVKNGHTFPLFNEPQPAWLTWHPKL